MNCLELKKTARIVFFWDLNEHLNQLKASKTLSLDEMKMKTKCKPVSLGNHICLLDPDTIGKPPAPDVAPWEICRSWYPLTSTEAPALVPSDTKVDTNEVWPEVFKVDFTLGYPPTVKEESDLELVEYSIEERVIRNFTTAVESLLPIHSKLDKKDQAFLQRYINLLNVGK